MAKINSKTAINALTILTMAREAGYIEFEGMRFNTDKLNAYGSRKDAVTTAAKGLMAAKAPEAKAMTAIDVNKGRPTEQRFVDGLAVFKKATKTPAKTAVAVKAHQVHEHILTSDADKAVALQAIEKAGFTLVEANMLGTAPEMTNYLSGVKQPTEVPNPMSGTVELSKWLYDSARKASNNPIYKDPATDSAKAVGEAANKLLEEVNKYREREAKKRDYQLKAEPKVLEPVS